MKKFLITMASAVMSFFVLGGANSLHAQITDQIHAHINHSFMIGNKTLPPGSYTFRIEQGTDMSAMTAQNAKGDFVDQFAVRQSIDNRTPNHSEVIFRKYGNTEFLTKIYEGGSRTGVAVTELSPEEQRLMNIGQHGIEHAEEQ